MRALSVDPKRRGGEARRRVLLMMPPPRTVCSTFLFHKRATNSFQFEVAGFHAIPPRLWKTWPPAGGAAPPAVLPALNEPFNILWSSRTDRTSRGGPSMRAELAEFTCSLAHWPLPETRAAPFISAIKSGSDSSLADTSASATPRLSAGLRLHICLRSAQNLPVHAVYTWDRLNTASS